MPPRRLARSKEPADAPPEPPPAAKRHKGAAAAPSQDDEGGPAASTPPRALATTRIFSPAASTAAAAGEHSPAAHSDSARAEQLRASFLASPHVRRLSSDSERPEESVIRVGAEYQAHVPRFDAAARIPASECDAQLLHKGTAHAAPNLALPRSSRDVARKPTPGAKAPRAPRDGESSPGGLMDDPGQLPPDPHFTGFAFPLPAGAPHDAAQERWLGWQLLKLGWSRKRQLPPELVEPPRRDWSAPERSTFAKGLSTHGKHFREILPAMPGRSLDELVERYYTSKAHKRMAQVDAEQASRNVRIGPCGTMGCLLHDNHAGPHQFSVPMGPRVRKPKIKGEDE